MGAAIVDAELAGSVKVADSLFPKDAPYCDVDLTPRWDYDSEKARLLNCPQLPTILRDSEAHGDEPDMGLVLGLSLGVGIPLLLVVAAVCFLIGRRSGYSQMQEKPSNSGTAPSVVGSRA